MQFATLSSSFCPFQPRQPTKREDLFVLLKGKTPKIGFHLWLSAKRMGSTPISDSKLVSKKGFKGLIQWITVPTCTCYLIFMFNLLVPEALADNIDEKGTMEEQSLNNCRQESCVVSGLFSWSDFLHKWLLAVRAIWYPYSLLFSQNRSSSVLYKETFSRGILLSAPDRQPAQYLVRQLRKIQLICKRKAKRCGAKPTLGRTTK